MADFNSTMPKIEEPVRESRTGSLTGSSIIITFDSMIRIHGKNAKLRAPGNGVHRFQMPGTRVRDKAATCASLLATRCRTSRASTNIAVIAVSRSPARKPRPPLPRSCPSHAPTRERSTAEHHPDTNPCPSRSSRSAGPAPPWPGAPVPFHTLDLS